MDNRKQAKRLEAQRTAQRYAEQVNQLLDQLKPRKRLVSFIIDVIRLRFPHLTETAEQMIRKEADDGNVTDAEPSAASKGPIGHG